MSEATKIADLKKMLQTENASWTVNEKFSDTDELDKLPKPGLGIPEDYPELSPEEKETKLPLKELLEEGTNNVFLIERRMQEGISQPLSNTNVTKVINPKTSEIIDVKRLQEGGFE